MSETVLVSALTNQGLVLTEHVIMSLLTVLGCVFLGLGGDCV